MSLKVVKTLGLWSDYKLVDYRNVHIKITVDKIAEPFLHRYCNENDIDDCYSCLQSRFSEFFTETSDLLKEDLPLIKFYFPPKTKRSLILHDIFEYFKDPGNGYYYYAQYEKRVLDNEPKLKEEINNFIKDNKNIVSFFFISEDHNPGVLLISIPNIKDPNHLLDPEGLIRTFAEHYYKEEK